MNKSIIIEVSQQASIDNYLINYGDLDDNEIENNITNSRWGIELPENINMEVGDTIQLENASLSTKGLGSDSIEFIGTAKNNLNLTDNKIQLETGFYINDNWTNNLTLPKGIAYIKDFPLNYENNKFRNTNYVNEYNKYNIPSISGSTFENIDKVFASDYGSPSVETFDDWLSNAPISTKTPANKLNTTTLTEINNELYVNTTCCGNLTHFRPSEARLYLGQGHFIGMYNNGYNSYRNINLGTEGQDYNQIYNIKKSTSNIEVDIGFSSPDVVGNKITEQLLSPVENKNDFVEPRFIDYNNINNSIAVGLSYKNFFNTSTNTQITSDISKITPTSFGQLIYDLQDGITNFSISVVNKLTTNIPYPNKAQRMKYMYNNLLSGNYKRTSAITELYSNLNNSKNIDTLNENNIDDSSFYTGSILPDTNWSVLTTPIITSDAYPPSQPRELGEQMVIFDDLTNFTKNFTAEDVIKPKNNLLTRSLDYKTFENDSTNYQPIGFPVGFKVLNLQNNNVIMTNMIANKLNFEKLKRVRDLIEKPTQDNVKINYNSQLFKDTLCMSLELGRLDDRFSQSIYNINNFYDANANVITLPNQPKGIPMPCCLPCPKNIADNKELGEIGNYDNGLYFPRLPLLAGLFADEKDILVKIENPNPAVPSQKPKVYTYIDEFKSNNMYEMDFYSRYNPNRTPSSGNLILPDTSSFPSSPLNELIFSFKNENGLYYDDSEIKNNDLGVVVAYKTLVEVGLNVLEMGRGANQNNNEFSLYSVNTTNNYSVNTGIFVNINSNNTFSNLTDNSVSSGANSSDFNSVYLSQNSTNNYSTSLNQVNINDNNAIVIEYDSKRKITPSQLEIFQEASYPIPEPVPPPQPPVSEQLFGGSVGDGGHSLSSNFNSNFQNLYNDEIFNNYGYSQNNGFGYFIINWKNNRTIITERIRLWFATPSWNALGYYPQTITINGYNDATLYNENDPSTFDVIYFEEYIPVSAYNNDPWISTSTAPLSVNGINKCKDILLTSSNGYKYNKLMFDNGFSTQQYLVLSQVIINGIDVAVNYNSKFPLNYTFQAKDDTNNWITLSNKSLTTAPLPYGSNGSTYPSNPALTLPPPYKDNFNSQLTAFNKFRWIFSNVESDNLLVIGELCLYRNNQTETILGNNNASFIPSKLTYELVNPTTHIKIPNSFVNLEPSSINDYIQDGALNNSLLVSFNTDNVFSTTNNKINLKENEKVLDIKYDFETDLPLISFAIWTSVISVIFRTASPKIIKISLSKNNIDYIDVFSKSPISSTIPTLPPNGNNIDDNTPYFETFFNNPTFTSYRYIRITIYSNFNADNTSNIIDIPDILINRYNSINTIKNNIPFIGFNCMPQLPKSYEIPLPVMGEFFGISPSLQNNQLSFCNTWENQISEDENGQGVGSITITSGGSAYTSPPVVAFVGGGGSDAAAFTTIDGGKVVSIQITDNGKNYTSPPVIFFNGGAGTGGVAVALLGNFRNSYNPDNSLMSYINVGSNNMNCSFDSSTSRMFFSRLHTLMKQGQASSNMLRYYEGIQQFNNPDIPITEPDASSGNNVCKINRRRFEVNSQRAGFTEQAPERIASFQILPISNKAIKSKGIASSLSGIGILNVKIGKKDGSYIDISKFNDFNYKGSLLDKLGMSNIQQLLPPFGQQNRFYNRNTHSSFINKNNMALSMYNNSVFPFTTNALITPTFNQSVNTNNLGFEMGQIDADNNLEKSVPQISDELIFDNLPSKFAYSHLLIYSNIIPKYNFIGGKQINKIPCIGTINRSYESGDYLYLNQNNPEYEVDLNYNLSDVMIDIRMPNGLPAPLSEGSSVSIRINKKKALPLFEEEAEKKY